jgi:hypothetical protein
MMNIPKYAYVFNDILMIMGNFKFDHVKQQIKDSKLQSKSMKKQINQQKPGLKIKKKDTK